MGNQAQGSKLTAQLMSDLFVKLETIRVKHAAKGQESGVGSISWNRGQGAKVTYGDDFNQIVTKTNQVYAGSKYLKGAYNYTAKTSAIGSLITAADFNFWGGTAVTSGTTVTSGVIEALDGVCAHDASNYTSNHSGHNGSNYTTNHSGHNGSNYTSNRSGHNGSNYTSNRSGYNGSNYTSNRSGHNGTDYPSNYPSNNAC